MADAGERGLISRVIGDKRRWRAYKARVGKLPPDYRAAASALERYLMFFVPVDGDSAATMFEDLADLFERAEADKTPIREIVGEDPTEFADVFVNNYTEGGYVPARERKRLVDALKRAES